MKLSLFFLILFLVGCGPKVSLKEIKGHYPASFREIYDREGKLIHETRINFKGHRRNWISYSDIPKDLVQELVRFEDQRFFQHHGVDFLAIFSSLKDYPHRGASTLSMQVAKLLEPKRGKRSLWNKVSQIKSALELELNLSKEEILELYFNLVSFRGDLEGLPAASWGVFSKHPKVLNQTERLLLLAMLPSPNQTADKLAKRACRYSKTLKAADDCQQFSDTIAASHYQAPQVELAIHLTPHLSQKLSKEQSSEIHTSLVKNIQEASSVILNSHLRLLQSQNVRDGAVLIVERSTGQIVSYVGSSEYSQSPQVDHVQALRQAGSTLKPFIFAQAIAGKLITMTTPLRDEPFTITREGLTYQPENYQKSFTFKEVPAKIALGSSLNIPAIRVIDLVSPTRFYGLLEELEMRKLAPEEHYGHSMALGAVDITLWDLVRGYLTLAESGKFRELSYAAPKPIQKTIPEFSSEVSFIMSSILSEKENRHLTFGIQSSLSTDSWSAVKTGTSKDMRDNWCVGFTDKYVIGVWVGNSSGDPMWNVTGISGAAPIFNQLVSYLHRDHASMSPIKPATIVSVADDHYLAGTEPRNQVQLIISKSVKKITFPQNGSQFAYDPEIPEKHQRINFQASYPTGSWKLNGKILSSKELEEGFLPSQKGKYLLELWEGNTQLQDQVTFYVKAGKSQN